jgi:hypothetical protein
LTLGTTKEQRNAQERIENANTKASPSGALTFSHKKQLVAFAIVLISATTATSTATSTTTSTTTAIKRSQQQQLQPQQSRLLNYTTKQ